jgi:hypothetical protein
MSSKTTNYNLHKIDLADSPPDITVLNQNFDTIDAELKKSNDHIASKNNPHGVTLTQLGVDANATELNHIKGVTSNIQTQLDDKTPSSHATNKNNPHGVTAEQVGAIPSAGGNAKGPLGVSYSTFTRDNPDAHAVIKQGTDGDVGFYNELQTDVYCGLRVQPITNDTMDISNHIRFRVRNKNFNHMFKLYGSHNIDDLASSLGAAKIAFGSYVGTGTYGADNPNSITFDFVPKVVWIYYSRFKGSSPFYSSTYFDNTSMVVTDHLTTDYVVGYGFNSDGNSTKNGYAKKSSDGKTIYWYQTSANYKQFNKADTEYCYMAFS